VLAVTAAVALCGLTVDRDLGYAASVDGFHSWFGSYGMGDLGPAWCIDHGSRAPDAAYGYAPVEVADQPIAVRTAVAWAIGSAGADALASGDRPAAAAVMLAVHDLMGAVYPSGPLDVDQLPPSALAGFDGDGADVLAMARAIKADALAHQSVQAPYDLTITAGAGEITVRLRDATGAAVGGVEVDVTAEGAVLAERRTRTGDDGTATIGFTAGDVVNGFDATAALPDPVLHAYASTSTPAQRVAVPARVTVTAHDELAATTTTTSPTTTSTTAHATTTSAPRRPPPSPTLPRTGAASGPLALVGLGLVALGVASSRAAAHRHHR
jgi:hypothetical protein